MPSSPPVVLIVDDHEDSLAMYAFGLLAMGFIDLVVESALKPWDVQALIPIVEGAGGFFTSWDGGDAQNGGRCVAAGDRRVHEAALEVLRQVR